MRLKWYILNLGSKFLLRQQQPDIYLKVAKYKYLGKVLHLVSDIVDAWFAASGINRMFKLTNFLCILTE